MTIQIVTPSMRAALLLSSIEPFPVTSLSESAGPRQLGNSTLLSRLLLSLGLAFRACA